MSITTPFIPLSITFNLFALKRQQEYAEARLRILGDAGSTEDNKPKPLPQKSFEQVCHLMFYQNLLLSGSFCYTGSRLVLNVSRY